MKKNYNRIWLTLACAAVPFIGINAQDSSDDSEVFVLSPFTVTGDDDVGYMATSTLAGTRMKSQLRDLGSSISIVNLEFMTDTNSNDLQDVLLFTPNTEVAGIAGNFSGSQGFGGGNPIPELERDQQSGGVTRIRGLAAADLTRDYFMTEIPFDSFNVDRITVQRGANSALFGLGSPGGVVNNTTARANFLRDSGHVKLQTDQYGTKRASFRVNQILVDDRVSLFVAGLYEDRGYEQKEAFADDERWYASLNINITDNIRAHASFEYGERNSSRPDFTPPNDGITPWIEMGKPVFENPSEGGVFWRGSGAILDGHANNQYFSYIGESSLGFVSFYYDVNNPQPSFGGNAFQRSYVPGLGNGTAGELFMASSRPAFDVIRRSGHYPNGTPVAEGTSGFFSNGYANSQILDRSVFDYREHLFSGGSSQQTSDWKAITGSLEGTWWDNKVGFEVAVFDQTMDTKGFNSLQGINPRTIYIDANKHLPATVDGTLGAPVHVYGDEGEIVSTSYPNAQWIPNPNFGKPTMGGLSGGNNRDYDRKSMRYTAFLELRADDFLEEGIIEKVLGRIKLTALFQDRKKRTREAYSRDKIDHESVASAIAGGYTSGTGVGNAPAIHYATYRTGMAYALPYNSSVNFLGANSASDIQGANIGAVPYGTQRSRPPLNNTFTGWDWASERYVDFQATTHTLDDNSGFPATFYAGKGLEDINSKVLVGQHYLWNDTIVLTGTWRNDKIQSTSISAPAASPYPQADNTLDPAYIKGPLHENLALRGDKDTTSWSVMVHTPEFIKNSLPNGTELSVYMSEADNFVPTSGRRNVYGDGISPITGSTEEKGFIFSTMDGKLVARVNWYETGNLNNSFESGPISATEGILRGLVEQLDNPLNIAQGFTASDSQAVLPPQGTLDLNGFDPNWTDFTVDLNRDSADSGTQDFTSKGNEIEISYNPTSNWTMMIGIARQETITSNTWPTLQRYIAEVVEPLWINSSFAQNYIINATTGETLAVHATNTIIRPTAIAITQDGNPQIEQREWRFNFNTSYRFSNDSGLPDWMGDFTVGGGLRWQDKVGVGFGVSMNEFGNYALDADKPFYGPDQYFIDVFARSKYEMSNGNSFTVQLNIRDLTDNSDLVPLFANPDGSMVYRFLEGRVVSLSGTYAW